MELIWKSGLSVFVLLALYWGCKLFLYLKEKHALKGVIWQVDLQKVFLAPLKLLFFSWGIYYLITFLNKHFALFSEGTVLKSLRDLFVLVSCFWMAYRWKKELFQKKWHALSMAEVLNKLISATFFVLFVLMALGTFHIDIVPLLAFGGIGAAALGFAAKDVLGNFFGGGMLALTRPFSKGDMIFLPDRNLEGTVEEMGWYFTSIRDKDKCPIYFPNALFSNVPVVNTSRMSHRRIYETFHLAHQDFAKVTKLTETLREFLSHHPKIDTKPPVLVYWKQVGEYSLEIIIDVYTYATQMEEYVLAREVVLQDIFKVLKEMGIEISYPTSVIQVIQTK
jgi:MscS family membrane protein